MSRKKVAVIDYGMGNLHSVASAVRYVAPNADVSVTDKRDIIADADHVIFPGVGAMRDCMAAIHGHNIDVVVRELIRSGKPLLAICVGMQALMQRSDENDGVECLNAYPGSVKFFGSSDVFNCVEEKSQQKLKVPHMGWNQVTQNFEHPLWHGIENESRFYFVHSYYVQLENNNIEAGKSHYGMDFTAAIAKKNVFATQFHPEKSHDSGLRLIKNFIDWDGVFA